ncbi:MAG: type II secretion system protein [Verrucomicrobiales bacterium]|nr:type II secretion system protein [Verrucomicrobiales bacterium]
MKISSLLSRRASAMTLLELLIVMTIIAVLISILIPGIGKVKLVAEASKNTVNLREINLATLNWAEDNGGKLPSPEYPGGMEVPASMEPEDFFPKFFDLGESGLWIDGVVFGTIYMRENKDGEVSNYQVDEKGTHLKGTLFESTQSVKQNPEEEDWHRHSYAMNASLQYDRIYDKVPSEDPYLTEKTVANLIFRPKAMLYIENQDSNVVRFEDRESIIETSEERWDGGKLIATFLDGHAERIHRNDIPDEDPESDRESSRFWRGIDP